MNFSDKVFSSAHAKETMGGRAIAERQTGRRKGQRGGHCPLEKTYLSLCNGKLSASVSVYLPRVLHAEAVARGRARDRGGGRRGFCTLQRGRDQERERERGQRSLATKPGMREWRFNHTKVKILSMCCLCAREAMRTGANIIGSVSGVRI